VSTLSWLSSLQYAGAYCRISPASTICVSRSSIRFALFDLLIQTVHMYVCSWAPRCSYCMCAILLILLILHVRVQLGATLLILLGAILLLLLILHVRVQLGATLLILLGAILLLLLILHVRVQLGATLLIMRVRNITHIAHISYCMYVCSWAPRCSYCSYYMYVCSWALHYSYCSYFILHVRVQLGATLLILWQTLKQYRPRSRGFFPVK